MEKQMMSADRRNATVSIYSEEGIPKGLVRNIIREALEVTLEEFADAYHSYSVQTIVIFSLPRSKSGQSGGDSNTMS